MKLVIQKVKNASLEVDNKVISEINKGFVVYVGFTDGDTSKHFDWFVNKLCGLRIFPDSDDKMNLSIKDLKGELLIVSNFTLYADCKHGFRPSFCNAMEANKANVLYEEFLQKVKDFYPYKVCSGIFGADMLIKQENDGPINIILDEKDYFKD